MSSNPFTDYQEQFFKMYNENMEKMINSEAYKNMTKNIPGSEAYAKAIENMIPGVEKYWKNVLDSMPVNAMNDYWKPFFEKAPNMQDYWKSFFESAPNMQDYWKSFFDKMPSVQDYWKPFLDSSMDVKEYWKPFFDMAPNMQDYYKSVYGMMPGMNNYWDAFSKMMPDPSKFNNMAPFKIPGMDGFTKVFDFWKSFGDPESTYADLRNKYMDSVADIIKGLFPENMQPFAVKPVDFMNMMVDYYKQYVAPYVEIDADILKRIANGDSKAYVDFFRDYQKKYEESVEKYFNVMGMGLNREADEDYRKAVNAYNKAMISMGELMAVISETAIDSYNQIGDRIQEDLAEGKSLTTFNDFYNVWYSVTEAAFEKLLSTDEFAVVFDDFSDKYAQYMIAQNKVYERMLAVLPIPTNTDMKSLYKTVYDLRKDVRDLKKGVAGLKEEKGDK